MCMGPGPGPGPPPPPFAPTGPWPGHNRGPAAGARRPRGGRPRPRPSAPRAPGPRGLLAPSGWGGELCPQSTRVATPLASWAPARRAPAGRRATSHWAWATASPPNQGTSLRRTPVRPTVRIRAPWPQPTVRALGVQPVTTHAPLRSRRTKAQSVYHVPGLRDGDAPTSPLKDTRLLAVACTPIIGRLSCFQ